MRVEEDDDFRAGKRDCRCFAMDANPWEEG